MHIREVLWVPMIHTHEADIIRILSDVAEDGVSALHEDFSPSKLTATTSNLPPPTRPPSSLVVFVSPTPELVHTAVATATHTVEPLISKRLANRRERTALALAAMLEAESTRGPSQETPAPAEEDGDSITVDLVGVNGRRVRAAEAESSQLKWGTIDTNPIVWGTFKDDESCPKDLMDTVGSEKRM
jgi:hypothetical protein